MQIEYVGLKEINGPFVILQDILEASYEEVVKFKINNEQRTGRVIKLEGNKAVVQVFEGTENFSLNNTKAHFTGKPMEIKLSEEVLGRVFNGAGMPIDNMGSVYAEVIKDINGSCINPVSRTYPKNFIQTGISTIDGLITLIRGQKLPIFSGDGLPHNDLAAQIIRQASLKEGNKKNFAIVFGAMGLKYDVANFFKRTFKESGVLDRVVSFLNFANDPVLERILTPRLALTTAEYLAFDKNMHVLVILTDITSYAEALREVSSYRGEIPSRKGFPGYLYSELASLFERAGVVKGCTGSITQIPILTMPNDDITHPVPDLTGYITEGQIVLDRTLMQKGIYPPINILPSLSRLMKDGIGENFTREDHKDLANQIFASYSRVIDVRALASVIGEEELSDMDKLYIKFGKAFENTYLNQSKTENRTMESSISLAWKLLSILPKTELNMITTKFLDKYYLSGDAYGY